MRVSAYPYIRIDHQLHPTEGAGKLTIKEAKAIIRALGMTLRKTEYGDFRVNYYYAGEPSAYYTTDLQDAVDTAIAMKRHRA